MGEPAAIETIVQALRFAQQAGRFRIHEESELYANRRSAGARLYLTVTAPPWEAR
jgi:hypothetical protein